MNVQQKEKVEELKKDFINKVESLITSGSARESFLNVYEDINSVIYVMMNYPYDISEYYQLRWTIKWYKISEDGLMKSVDYSSDFIEKTNKIESYTYSDFNNERSNH